MEEHEYKWLVNDSTFHNLYTIFIAKGFNETKRILHINYYYDTRTLHFNRAGETIRVRQDDKKLVGTIKSHLSSNGSGLSIENNFKIDSLKQAIQYKGEEAIFQGQLVTERLSTIIVPGLIVCFDKNYYLGTVDYEIELEYEEIAAEESILWFTFINGYIKKCEKTEKENSSKSGRFFKKKKSILF